MRIREAFPKPYWIGIVGPEDGTGSQCLLDSILELAVRSEHDANLPRLHLAACAQAEPSAKCVFPEAQQIPRLESLETMLAAHPEINLVIDLTGNPESLGRIRRVLPPSISLLDRAGAIFLYGLRIMSEESAKCKNGLRGSQSLLRTIMDGLPDDIFFVDPQGNVVDVNRSASVRHKLPREELIHTPCSAIPAGPGQTYCESTQKDWPLITTLAHQKEAEALQTWMDDQGRVHYYLVTTYPVTDEDGRINMVIEVRRDVTLRTEIEKRLQQAEKLAAIGELSTYIAHEIRNPLFAIGGFANALLRSSELTENNQEKVRIILEESKRLDTILKSIINFTRPTASAITEVNVNQLVAETMRVLGIGYEDRGISLDMRLGEEVPNVRGNEELLKQCLINLVKNSVEAMPEGGRLRLTTTLEQQQVRIVVEDTGRGIPEEIQDKIFNPFFTTKKTGGGAGLGLAMTRKIISDMGGDVDLESRPGKGTRVTLTLQPYVSVERTSQGLETGDPSDAAAQI